jgi:hypothetical protein
MVMAEATLASNTIEFVIHLPFRNDPSSLDSPNNALKPSNDHHNGPAKHAHQ